jgi:hypothetical protein
MWTTRTAAGHPPGLGTLRGDVSQSVTAVFPLRLSSGTSSFRSRVDPDPPLRKLRFGEAAASTGRGRHGAIFQPVVRRGCPLAPWSALVTTVVPGEPLGRLSTPTLTMPSGRGDGIIVGVLTLRFRFPF